MDETRQASGTKVCAKRLFVNYLKGPRPSLGEEMPIPTAIPMPESTIISGRTPLAASESQNHNGFAGPEAFLTHNALFSSKSKHCLSQHASANADLPAVLTPQRSRPDSTSRPTYYKSPSSVSSPSLATAVRTPGTTTPVHRGFLGGQSRRSSGMSSTHEGVNPHAAADLLRQAMMHR